MGEPIRTARPAVLPVGLSDLKDQARIDGSAEDHLLLSYLYAAVEEVERYARLSLITQTWEQRFPAFKDEMIVRVKPVQSVSIQYLDPDEGSPPLLTLASSIYNVVGIGADKAYPSVRLGTGQSWPIALTDPEAVRISIQAGFGDTAGDVPELIRHAVLLTAATWIKNREDTVSGANVSEVPWASRALLRDWRPLAVA